MSCSSCECRASRSQQLGSLHPSASLLPCERSSQLRGESEWFQAVFSHCLCCAVSTDILGIAVLRGSCEYTGSKPAGRAGGRDTRAFSIKAAKDGSGFCSCAGEGRGDTALLMWLQAHRVTHRVTGLFDRRQLRGEAERSQQTAAVLEVQGMSC